MTAGSAPLAEDERRTLLDRVRQAEGARADAERERDAALVRLYEADHQRRRRFARDLHDHVGPHVAMLMLGLRRIASHVASDNGAQEVAALTKTVEALSAVARRMTVELRSSPIDAFGVAATMRLHVEAWSVRTGIAAEFHEFGHPRPVPPDVGEALFMGLQEALTNVARHAAAPRHVSVALTHAADHLSFTVEDDGAGPPAVVAADVRVLTRAQRFGLAGMRERFRLAGGSLDWETARRGGFTLIGRFPLEEGRP